MQCNANTKYLATKGEYDRRWELINQQQQRVFHQGWNSRVIVVQPFERRLDDLVP